MARAASEILTEREAQIMEVLWRLESATADQVRTELPDDPHDSSVRTFLRVLIDKGYAQFDAKSKPRIYRPAISQSTAQRTATKSLLQRFFGGSAESFVLRLLEDEQLTMAQIEELRESLVKDKKGRQK